MPLAVLGQALYRHPDLAFCVERGVDMDRFWSEDFVAPEKDRHRYLSWIHHQCLAGGDFYAKEGMEAAAQSLKAKIERALECRVAAIEAPSNVVEGVFSVEKRASEG